MHKYVQLFIYFGNYSWTCQTYLLRESSPQRPVRIDPNGKTRVWKNGWVHSFSSKTNTLIHLLLLYPKASDTQLMWKSHYFVSFCLHHTVSWDAPGREGRCLQLKSWSLTSIYTSLSKKKQLICHTCCHRLYTAIWYSYIKSFKSL